MNKSLNFFGKKRLRVLCYGAKNTAFKNKAHRKKRTLTTT